MPSKKILENRDKKVLIELINNNKSATEIVNSFDKKYSYKNIMKFSNEINMKNKLSGNNKAYKSFMLKKYSLYNRIKRLKNIEKMHGNKINKMVKSGKILEDIMNETKLTPIPLVNYLKYAGLNDIRIINSKKVIANNARMHGKNNKMKGVEIKPLSDDVIKYFNKLKDDGVYRRSLYKKIKKKYGYGFKKYIQLCEKYGFPNKKSNFGKNNPMYGKSPSLLSGIGISGAILNDKNKYYFRSSLELKVFLYLIDNNIKFKISKHRIHYTDIYGHNRTYNPDIIIGNTLYEIKPQKMIKLKAVEIKKNAAVEYCNRFSLKYEFITENTFDLKYITFDKINKMIRMGVIKLNKNKIKNNYERLRGAL